MKLTDWCTQWSPSLWMSWFSQTDSASVSIQDVESQNVENADVSRLAFLVAFFLTFYRNRVNDISRFCNCTPVQAALICAVTLGAAFNGLSIPSVIFQMMNGWTIGQTTPVIQISVYIGIIFSVLSGTNQLADIFRFSHWKNLRIGYEALQDGFSAFFFALLGVLAIAEYFIKNASNLGFIALCSIPGFIGFGQFGLGLLELDHFNGFSKRNKNRLNSCETILDALQIGFTIQSFFTFFAIVAHINLSPTLKLIFWAFSIALAIIPIYLKCRGYDSDKIDKVCDFFSGLTYFLGVLQTFELNSKAFYSPGAAWIELIAFWGLISIVLPSVTMSKYPIPEKWYADEDDNEQDPRIAIIEPDSKREAPIEIETSIEPSPSFCSDVSALGKSITGALNCGSRKTNDAETVDELVPLTRAEVEESSWLKSRCVIS